MSRKVILLFLSCCLSLSLPAADLSPFRKPCYRHASLSICVIDLKTGSTVVQHNADQSIVPASTLKLLTTAAALEILGPDHRIETRLEATGTLTDGVLNGDLIVRGGGDPSLGSRQVAQKQEAFLDEWVRMVQAAGIRSIKGRVLADASLFGDEPLSPYWLWEDIGNYYAPGIHGLAVFDNAFRLELKSGFPGTRPSVAGVWPEIPGLVINNHLVAAANDLDSAYLYGAPFQLVRDLFGTMPANRSSFTIRGDMPDPPVFLAQRFAEALQQKGIEVFGLPTSFRLLEPDDPALSDKVFTVGTWRSVPVSEMIGIVHAKSDNLYTEYLVRQLALKEGIVPATSVQGLSLVRKFWKQKGLDMTALSLWDACGLSPNNRVSARFLAEVLQKESGLKPSLFEQTLPLAGKEGTVSSFLRGTVLEGKLRLKSGSNQTVNTYAGYYRNKGRTFAVVLMVNHAAAPRFQIREDMTNFLLSL